MRMNRELYIKNAEGKEWIIPEKNAKTAMELYQPVAWKGKLIKKALPVCCRLGAYPFPHEIGNLRDTVPGEVMESLECVFGEDIEISYFGGSPGTHKKPTLQLFKGKNILGYAKYSEKQEIQRLFDNEEIILNQLRNAGIEHIPNCLLNRRFEDGVQLFVQDTEKTVGSATYHSINRKHKEFMKDLFMKTKKKIPFQESQFAKMLEKLGKISGCLEHGERSDIDTAYQYVRKNYPSTRWFGVCHRDFTPWNTCIAGEHLFVFDWEYARETYPYGVDYARLYVEICRRERGLGNQQIAAMVRGSGIPKIWFISYLLDNICLYLERRQESDRTIVDSSAELLHEALQGSWGEGEK